MYTFPTSINPSFSYDKKEEFNTLIHTYASGKEGRSKLVRHPKHEFTCVYRNKTSTERDTLHDFYRQVFGSGDSFWFIDFKSRKWIDEYVGRGGPLELIGAIVDDGGTWTPETPSCIDGTANGMHLLPAAPVVNDAYYFGSGAQFDKLTLTIGTQGVGVWTITWEYWDGDSWASLAGVTDNTVGFTAAVGDRNLTFTVPVDWVITSVYDINAYWIRARVSAFTSITTRPLGSGCISNSKIYDLHGVTTSSVSLYIDGVLKTGGGADYTFVSGGGGGGADRILLTAYPATGSLLTSNHTGFLRIRGRLTDDNFQESLVESSPSDPLFNIQFGIREVQW